MALTPAVPRFLTESALGPMDGSWLLYGGRVRANVPVTATVMPTPNDADPLDFAVVMELDVVEGRLACISLTAERLNDGPPITSEALRRIPVAEYAAGAALNSVGILMERVPVGHGEFREVPFTFPEIKDFAKDGMTDEALEQVARIYAMAQASGLKATGILLSEYGMPRPTATRWIQTARRRGILRDDHQQKPGMTRERREKLHRERAAKQWKQLTAKLTSEEPGG